MSDVTLSAAVRNSLLSLQNTTDLISRTNERLASGLRVGSPIDDPVAFFSSKSLNDRAFDFTERKEGIDQGISTVTAALDGVDGIDNLVRQLKGIANSLKSATGNQFTDLLTQFNDIRGQVGDLASDAEYQGVNLIDNTSQTLTVNFANNTSSVLTINAAHMRETGLGIDGAQLRSDTALSFAASTGINIAATATNTGSITAETSFANLGGSITVTFNGTGERVFTSTGGGTLDLTFGTATFTIQASTGASVTVSQGATITLQVVSNASVVNLAGATTAASAAQATAQADLIAALGNDLLAVYSGALVSTAATPTVTVSSTGGAFQSGVDFVAEGEPTDLDEVIIGLDAALATLRTESQKLGSNVALLQTRLDFTEAHVNTLEEGAGKLTLADLNQEGANLLALQTRQQLGISALSFAGQAEQGILGLFN